MTSTNNSKIMDLIIKKYPHKVKDENNENFDVTFEIANNTVSPFQSVDYFINGLYETVGVMGDAEEKQKGQIFKYDKTSIPIDKLTTIIDSPSVSREPLPVARIVNSDVSIPTTTGKAATNWLKNIGKLADSTTRPVSGFNLFGKSNNNGPTSSVVSTSKGISKTNNMINNFTSIVPKASSLSDVLAKSITNALKSKKKGGKGKNNRKTKKNPKK
jgi:hypothetical protein